MVTALLVDIGSTFTKAVCLDLDAGEIKGTSQAPTTVHDNVLNGLRDSISILERRSGVSLDGYDYKFGTSSAAGGLRLTAIGLVPDLTARAAGYAAESAGAKIIDVFSYKLSDDELTQLIESRPDVLLLAGGTDGGDEAVIRHNAKMLARTKLNCAVIVAGNKAVTSDVAGILRSGSFETILITENVMPRLNELNIRPAHDAIRRIFVDTIIQAKGIAEANDVLDDLFLPTPEAVLSGAHLVSEALNEDLLVVEVGGATTDIHSIASGNPSDSSVIQRGLEEPREKRTVEGDLGIRWNATRILDHCTEEIVTEMEELFPAVSDIDLDRMASTIEHRVETGAATELLPRSDADLVADAALAYGAGKIATARHVGSIERRLTPTGEVSIQLGKDLTEVTTVIGSGGVLVKNPYNKQVLTSCLRTDREFDVLKPQDADFYVDSRYILFAVGILHEKDICTQSVADIFINCSLQQL